jgi:VanZ family protein
MDSQSRIRKLIVRPVVFLWAVAVAGVIVLSLLPQGSVTESETRTGIDKLVRFVVFSGLSFVPAAFITSFRLGVSLATSMAPLGFLLEMAQKYVPTRQFSPEDIIANNMGTILGIGMAIVIRALFYTGGRHKDP